MEQFGYLFHSTQLADVETIVQQAKHVVFEKADEIYRSLLVQEIEAAVDDIALNICRRPENQSILQAAQSVLDNKIRYAMVRQVISIYNFQVFAHLLSCGNSKDTYIQFGAASTAFRDALDGVAGLEPVGSDPDSSTFQQISKLLEEQKGTEPPIGIPIYSGSAAAKPVDPSALSFSPPSNRAETIARHTMSNRLLESVACGREIQNYQLMRYMDTVFELLDNPQVQNEMRHIQQELTRILPVITSDMITYSGSKTPECSNQSE